MTGILILAWHQWRLDNELGDTPLHIGGFMHYDAVEERIQEETPRFVAKR